MESSAAAFAAGSQTTYGSTTVPSSFSTGAVPRSLMRKNSPSVDFTKNGAQVCWVMKSQST